MSKTKAVQWPVLAAHSLAVPRTPCALFVPRTPLGSSLHSSSNTNTLGTPRKKICAKTHLHGTRQPIEHASSWSAERSSTRSSRPRPPIQVSGHHSRTITKSLASSVCSCGYYSPLLPTMTPPRMLPSGPGRSVARQIRQSHSHSTVSALPVEESSALRSPAQPGRKVRLQLSKKSLPTFTESLDQLAPVLGASTAEKKLPRRRKPEPWTHEASTHTTATRPLAMTDRDREATLLSNFRLLIHSDCRSARHLQTESASFQTQLLAEHRIPSSIIPPSSALQHLFLLMDSSNLLGQLSAADWNSYISWLSHHKDYPSMVRLHRIVTSERGIGERCSPSSYSILTEARLREMRSERSSRTIPGKSEPLMSSVIQKTVDWMEDIGVAPNQEMYGLWLRSAVEERNWDHGIVIWKRMKTDKRLEPSITMAVRTIQCHLHMDQVSDATKLFEAVLERSSTEQQRGSYEMLLDGGMLAGTGTGREESERESRISDARIEHKKRQKQAAKALASLQQTTSTPSIAVGSANSQHVKNWKAVAYPALIEAISLSTRDKDGATLSSELAIELHGYGKSLDATQFRFLVRHISASSSSEVAEGFMKRWIGLSSARPSRAEATLMTEKEGHTATIVPASPSKDLRKPSRAAVESARGLIDIGLLEVMKQSIEEQNFDRACRLFHGLCVQGTPVDSGTVEQLIVGLTRSQDFSSAAAVMERSLQDNQVPSIETADALLRGLVKADRLDESVAMFRDLTENHGLKPSAQMYRSLMRLTSSYGQLAMTQRILSMLKGLGVKQDWELYRDLMLCYVRSENLQGAIKVFENMDGAGIKNRIDHINVLLEGAVRQSFPPTVVGILEIMASQEITPNAETWNILLNGAFQTKDRVLAQEVFKELADTVLPGASVRADGALRASRHPVAFQLLMIEFAERHGVEAALSLLKGSLDAGYPNHVAPNLYYELISKSCREQKGAAGYAFYQLLRRSERAQGRYNRIASSALKGKTQLQNMTTPSPSSWSPSSLHSTSSSSILSPSPSVTSTSRSVQPTSPTAVYRQLMSQLDKECEYAVGKDMATDLIISGNELNHEMVKHAIRFYTKSGELTTAFGLFTKMGRAYGVEPTKEMVMDLVEAFRSHGLELAAEPSVPSSKGAALVGSEAQHWMRILKGAMARFGVDESAL
ncbi:unnamed protein product [Mortierella alpina]